MLAPLLMGIVAGQRAMTPLAVVAVAAARGELADDNGAPAIIGGKLVAAGALALAVAEMVGDKQKSAPDRVVWIGLAVRFVTGGVAGMALAPRDRRAPAALVGGLTAVVASWPGWSLRMATMPRYGQTTTGFVEDTVVIAAAAAITRRSGRA